VSLPLPFSIYNFKQGDEVQLRFTGDRGVPQRLGEAWGQVTWIPWAYQWRRVPPRRVPVEAYGEPGVERRVLLDQIYRVHRGGKVIAQRQQTQTGTDLRKTQDFR
jgi:hypothetical protein